MASKRQRRRLFEEDDDSYLPVRKLTLFPPSPPTPNAQKSIKVVMLAQEGESDLRFF